MSLGYKKRKKSLDGGARLKLTKSSYTTEMAIIPGRRRKRITAIRRRMVATRRIHGKIAAAKMKAVLDKLIAAPMRSFIRTGETTNGSF